MTNKEYLEAVLAAQALADDSDELKTLQKRREEVEEFLREEFGDSPAIRYGGSKAKGTMILESYDLDLPCYFPRDDDDAGGTLEDIFNNVKDKLSEKYVVVVKTQALRIKGANQDDLHIDVIPGRFIDEDKNDDVFLYQASGDKKRLKTNLEVQIGHVRDSGVRDAIKAMKLWKARYSIDVKTFVLELAVIMLLDGWKKKPLADQLTHVFEEFRDNIDSLTIEDPANPEGNDLSEVFNDLTRATLSGAARSALATVDTSGWEGLFGKVETEDKTMKSLLGAAARVTVPTRPWCRDV